MLGTFISTDTTEKDRKLYAHRLKNPGKLPGILEILLEGRCFSWPPSPSPPETDLRPTCPPTPTATPQPQSLALFLKRHCFPFHVHCSSRSHQTFCRSPPLGKVFALMALHQKRPGQTLPQTASFPTVGLQDLVSPPISIPFLPSRPQHSLSGHEVEP